MTILGLESSPENSHRGGGEMALSGCLLTTINFRPKQFQYLRSSILVEHDLFGPSFARRSGLREGGKPASTFPDHALGARVPALRPGGQKITLARLIIGNRTLKAVQRGCPKFHTIQILVQALKRFGEIANDLICRRFRHGIGPCHTIDVSAPVGLRGSSHSGSGAARCAWQIGKQIFAEPRQIPASAVRRPWFQPA